MPTHFQLSWVKAVKEWNEHQAFHDDIYAIPKKGGDSYSEVVSLREAFKKHHNGPTQKKEPKPEPKPETKLQLEMPISDLAEYHNALAGLRPHAAIAYYENKYPHLKKKKVEAKVAENVPEEDLNVAFDKDLTVDFSKFMTLEDKVKKIREVLFAGHFTRADKKAALTIALDILQYKENHIIQEARKPIQKEIVIMLNDIRKTPIFKKYNIVGHNPASGIPDYRVIDNSDLVNDIPAINAGLLEEIEKDQKANEKARKKADKEKEKRDMIEDQEREERDKKLNALVDVEAVKKRWGKYPDELIAYLVKNKIRDSLDFEREINKLPSDVPRRPQAVWKNFFVDLAEAKEPEPKPEPKPKPNPEPKPEPKVDAVKKYNDFLEKLKNESSGLKLKGMSFALTKEENKEYEELEKQAKEKSKNIKTVEEAKAFEKEQKKIQEKFKSKVYERNREESAKRFTLEKAANEARGIVEKPIEGKFFSFGDVFGSKKSEPKPEPKPEPIKSEDEWRGISEKSKLPEHEQKKGFQWLASKYNGLYASAVSKAKRIAQEGRPSFKTEKEYRDFVHLDFDAYGVDYREFFKDVLFADTQLYFYLQKNANKTKAPSYTSSAKEFRDWLKKH